jgi:predicted PurR-regulated permease PerM
MSVRVSRPPRAKVAPFLAQSHLALALAVGVTAILALKALMPLWLPLLLAAWFAHLARPLSDKLAERLRGRSRAAALVVVLLVLGFLTPLVLVVLSLAGDANLLFERILASDSASTALQSFISQERGSTDWRELVTTDPERVLVMLRENGASALALASNVAGATLAAILGTVVFVAGFYVFLTDGPRFGAWLERNLPLTSPQFRGFSNAFYETGRGLMLGVGLTALAQGLIACIGYLIAGVPHALVLGLLTAAAALFPSVGTALVWVPAAGVLAMSGRITDAVVVVVVGCIAGGVDNFLRPALSRFGRLRVPTFVLFCAMLGGLVAFGASGLLLGPLFVRLAMEGLRQWRRRDGPVIVT